MGAVISKAELSRQLGVSRAAVTGYVRRGMPVNPDGKLNSAAALAWVNNHIEPRHADRGAAVAADVPEGTAGPGADPRVNPGDRGDDRTALAAERARLARAQADAQEMKNAAARRLLLPRDEVTAAVQAAFSRVRARLLAIPTRAAPQVLLLRGMAEVKALLTALVPEALRELSETEVVPAEGQAPTHDDDDDDDDDPFLAAGGGDADDRGPGHR